MKVLGSKKSLARAKKWREGLREEPQGWLSGQVPGILRQALSAEFEEVNRYAGPLEPLGPH